MEPTMTKIKFNTVASTGRFIQVEDKLIPLINFRFMILDFRLHDSVILDFRYCNSIHSKF